MRFDRQRFSTGLRRGTSEPAWSSSTLYIEPHSRLPEKNVDPRANAASQAQPQARLAFVPCPKTLVAKLDQNVIGRDRAKRRIALGVCTALTWSWTPGIRCRAWEYDWRQTETRHRLKSTILRPNRLDSSYHVYAHIVDGPTARCVNV